MYVVVFNSTSARSLTAHGLLHHAKQEAVCAAGQLCMHGPVGTEAQPLLPPRAADDGLGAADLLFAPDPPEQVCPVVHPPVQYLLAVSMTVQCARDCVASVRG